MATGRGLTLQLTLAPQVPTGVLLDGLRLQQILNNLLMNGIKFTHRGEIHLEVGTHPAEPGRVGLWFWVTDSGPGIPPAERERIFEPFYQAAVGVVPNPFRGHGVGLPLSRKLALAMAGDLRMDSGPAGGSRFTLTLPDVPLADELDTPDATALPRPHEPPAECLRWTPTRETALEDLEVPPAEALTELRELVMRGLNPRIRAWCRDWSAPERQPAFAERVMQRAIQFDHASILALIDAALEAEAEGFARSSDQEESRP